MYPTIISYNWADSNKLIRNIFTNSTDDGLPAFTNYDLEVFTRYELVESMVGIHQLLA